MSHAEGLSLDCALNVPSVPHANETTHTQTHAQTHTTRKEPQK